MFFSKKGAKVLAIASTFAFVLTGMSVAPGKAQAAADQAPTVKVLGATLRLDGDSGKQSLRFGIEVSNASNAEACGIDITCNGKTITVGTDVAEDMDKGKKRNATIYSKDEANDKIVYSAVVKGITNGNYDKDFSVKGYVKDKIENVKKGESIAVNKSVNRVVETLKKQYPELGLKINETTGNLEKSVDGVRENVVNSDFGIKDNNINIITDDAIELDLVNDYVKMDDSTLEPSSNDDGSVTFEAAEGFAGVMYKLPYSLKSKEKVHVTVDYECTGCTTEGKNPSNTARVYLVNESKWGSSQSDIIGPAAKLEGDMTVNDGATADKLFIKANSYNTSFASMTIKKITVAAIEVTAPVEKPATGFDEAGTKYTLPINADTVKCMEDGGASTVTYNSDYNYAKIITPGTVAINAPKSVFEKNTFSKVIISYRDANGTKGSGYVAKYDTENMGWSPDEESHWGGLGVLTGSGTVEAAPNEVFTKGNFSGVRIFNLGSSDAPFEITITSVVFVKADESARPTATPTPPPEASEPENLEKGQVSLKNSSSYLVDGPGSTASYDYTAKELGVEISNFEGIVIYNPVAEEEYGDYKYVTIEYKLNGDNLNGYVFDGEMENKGKGREPAGQVQKGSLSTTGDYKKVTYSADKSLYGIKLVRINWNSPSDKASLKIKSVTFSDTDPSQVTP